MEAEESANMQQTTGSQVTSTSGASATSQDQAMDIPGTSMSGQGRELDTAGENSMECNPNSTEGKCDLYLLVTS